MRIVDGIKMAGTPFIIPDCSRDDLPGFFREKGYRVGAEIGVLKGEFTEKFCQAGLKIFAIDPWRAFRGQGRDQNRQEQQNEYYETARNRLAPYANCTIIRKTSMEAVNDFSPSSLDFVYIDGCHEFPYVAQDIYEWSKIVKKGGVISGHDYFNTHPGANNVLCHVKAVVDAYTTLYKIDNWWLFGCMKRGSGSHKFHSWMWVNR
uniref:Putative methyltransferase n=1 Tax=viral metagenome TaxID=1070528 RepID=A0A6H1ZSN1_9ZZZZ